MFGKVGSVPVVIMQGRVHYYEGYSMTDVVLPTRLMKKMGAEILFVTNASGGINYDFNAGEFHAYYRPYFYVYSKPAYWSKY